MSVSVLLLLAALSSCTGTAASANNVPKIVASAGETVLLPCSTTASDDVPAVEWSREGLPPDIAFLYRDGCETFEMKNPVFQYRTNLIRDELHHGNLSMVMSNVQRNDSGTYRCAIVRNPKTVIARVELFVGAVSEPTLSVVPDVGGGLTLQCEAKCWFPEPTIRFLDAQGNEISAEDPKRDKESLGCFTVKRRVTLQTATNRVTCRVHQPEVNQTRDSEIYISDECMKSYTQTIVITAVVMAIVVVCICALAHFLVQRGYLSVGGQKSSSEEDEIKRLTKELNDLKSRQSPAQQSSQSSNNPRSSPGTSECGIPPPPKSPYQSKPLKPASSANGSHPKSGTLPQTKDPKPVASGQNPARSPQMRRNSHGRRSPVSITNDAASSNPPDSTEKRLPRSTSLSEKRPRIGIPRSPRRNTLSGISNNPYDVLADLSEDENLIG
ncbi:butyrophilin subfamily 3 member A2-like [Oreochromis aureus]|uniref:butyrophilin subfamily 3 member A2-like n=1 Tax=Oreochromis aureus TaxID=47969 RepID=UPI001953E5C7|nr:butyrophilin subfamily 3 member A2-like [Oreochromis aureus]